MTTVNVFFLDKLVDGIPSWPDLGRDAIDLNGYSDERRETIAAPDKAKVAIVQCDEPLHFEINPPQNRGTLAERNSPLQTGTGVYNIGPGWTLSFQTKD